MTSGTYPAALVLLTIFSSLAANGDGIAEFKRIEGKRLNMFVTVQLQLEGMSGRCQSDRAAKEVSPLLLLLTDLTVAADKPGTWNIPEHPRNDEKICIFHAGSCQWLHQYDLNQHNAYGSNTSYMI